MLAPKIQRIIQIEKLTYLQNLHLSTYDNMIFLTIRASLKILTWKEQLHLQFRE